MTDDVDAAEVHRRLAARGVPWPRPRVVAATGSTNADLLAAAASGVAEGSVIVADEQTAGRGRMGRAWDSAPGRGLWCSTLVRMAPGHLADAALLPLAAGVAVVDAVRSLGRAVELKWPNDVVVGAADGQLRKVAGILAESDGLSSVVVGIGINVAHTREQLPVPAATSLALEGLQVSRTDLLVEVLAALRSRVDEARDDPAQLAADYRALCATLGRVVQIALPGGGELRGEAVDIAADGRLVVDTAGIVTYVAAGDVVHATI